MRLTLLLSERQKALMIRVLSDYAKPKLESKAKQDKEEVADIQNIIQMLAFGRNHE